MGTHLTKKKLMDINIILYVSLSSNVNYEYQCVCEFIDESDWSKNMNMCASMNKSVSMYLCMSVWVKV